MRYIDVDSTSRSRHGGKKQAGRGDETAIARGSPTTCGQDAARGCAGGQGPAPERVPLARGAQCRRDRCLTRHEQRGTPGTAGCSGVVAAVRGAARGSRTPRLYHAAMDAQAGSAVDRARVWCSIQRGPRLAVAGAPGLLQPEAGSAGSGARCRGHRALAQAHLAGSKKTPDARDD